MKTPAAPAPDIVDAIRAIVEQETGRFGFESLRVEFANDNEGEPVLNIAASYGKQGEPVDMQTLGTVASRVRERLLELGEERFPHIRYQFPDNRKVAS